MSRISSPSRTATGIGLLAGGAVVAVALTAAGPAGAASRTPKVTFGGSAYGSQAKVGTLVNSGETALVPLCNTKPGVTSTDKTAAVNLGSVGTIGAVHTSVSSHRSGSKSSSITSTLTAGTSLVHGLIKFSSITTRAEVTYDGKKYGKSGQTILVGFSLAGSKPRNVTPKVNQTIAIPGVGSLLLNSQSASSGQGVHATATVGVRLEIDAHNSAGLPAGDVVIGHSYATLHSPTYRQAHGYAYGTTVVLGNTVASGRTAPVTLPCGGSNGVNRTNTTGRATIPNALTAGADTSSARSTDSRSKTVAHTSNHLTDVSLLGGKVKVAGVTTEATATRTDKHLTLSANGTEIGGLTIDGKTYAPPAVGTMRRIGGLGTLYFGSAVKTRTGLTVFGLRLVLSAAEGRFAKGTVITVGSAQAGVNT